MLKRDWRKGEGRGGRRGGNGDLMGVISYCGRVQVAWQTNRGRVATHRLFLIIHHIMAGLQALSSLIYHEKQQPGSMLCAQHALNSLLRGLNHFQLPTYTL